MSKIIDQSCLHQICGRLRKIPEVRKARHWIEANPGKLNNIVERYLDLVGRMQGYSISDLKLIDEANQLMQEKVDRPKSESNLSAVQLLKALSADQKQTLQQTIAQAFDQNSPYFETALKQLAAMMYAGHEMFASGGTPKDGDPESDRLIWGHTQAREDVDPRVLTHFIIGHYLARYVSHAYPEVSEVQTKDGFLAAMIDVILLQEAKQPGSSQVMDIWMTSREKGGLGWMIPEYLEIYKELVKNNQTAS